MSEWYNKKNNGNQKKSSGDFHALIAEMVNKQITKVLKQQASNANKKRTHENSFYLYLDQTSVKGEDHLDLNMSDINWGDDDEKEE